MKRQGYCDQDMTWNWTCFSVGAPQLAYAALPSRQPLTLKAFAHPSLVIRVWAGERERKKQTCNKQMRMGGPWIQEIIKGASTLSGCFRSVLGLKVDLSVPVLRDLFCAPSVRRSKHKVKHPVFGKRVRHSLAKSRLFFNVPTNTHTHKRMTVSVQCFTSGHQKPADEPSHDYSGCLAVVIMRRDGHINSVSIERGQQDGSIAPYLLHNTHLFWLRGDWGY